MLPHYLVTKLRLYTFRYRSVILKCRVTKLVGGLMNGGRCAHGAASSGGELSPKANGTHLELTSVPSPCRLGGCEWNSCGAGNFVIDSLDMQRS